MRCKVDGCQKQLNDSGIPVDYCDWQQGRCPMQKKAFDINDPFDRFAAFILVPIMLLIAGTVIYVELL